MAEGSETAKAEVQVVYLGEQSPDQWHASVFLAGPTPRTAEVASWRPEAIAELTAQWQHPGLLVVFVPEARTGTALPVVAAQSAAWERTVMDQSDEILFWVPRTMNGLPGLSTNVEFGRYESSGRCVLGYPPEAAHIAYLHATAEHCNVPVAHKLPETVDLALKRVGAGSLRSAGHRSVPLLVWRAKSFQRWLAAQADAGNQLVGGELQWTFRVGPQQRLVLFWGFRAEVLVAAEGRVKSNEMVIGRPDMFTVIAYRHGATWTESEVVLVREFRSPARTPDGYIHELPGGSSSDEASDGSKTAAAELSEETGLLISSERLRLVAVRQSAGTVSSHTQTVYAVELAEAEMDRLRRDQGHHGNAEESEQTYVEVVRVADLLDARNGLTVDWTTVGIIAQALHNSAVAL
ncbi:NUDIX hydrolase [Streptomyces sp. NBC_01381]|uniref:nucleoside 2-deoxyribosyltransferase domain-containing protein n=1 Tax=Streptomyces sp. NBC_01381 TaxID=2903845 RepID=UPI00224F79A5|nr:nucleoside 2-deoxyribosyltransferase domain-containing protein [Streptomyces sp. NBC_01381]MCX4666464.1 NUDIX hydrolase [Streptomyces sp. NBC_01381]